MMIPRALLSKEWREHPPLRGSFAEVLVWVAWRDDPEKRTLTLVTQMEGLFVLVRDKEEKVIQTWEIVE